MIAYLVPYRVSVPEKHDRAFDQLVADIWSEGDDRSANPYYGGGKAKLNLYLPFESLETYRARLEAKTIYSVWRLDGPTVELAKGLVDKAIEAEQHGLKGRACFDMRGGNLEQRTDTGYDSGDWWLYRASEFARRGGMETIDDHHEAEFGTDPAPRCDGAALYSGWYSLGHYNDAFTWNVGAIGWHLDSESALTPRRGANWSANALKRGITVTSGAVAEPYLQGLARPDGVVLYLLQGANVGDAFLRSTPWLKWMIINMGDPLYRPFPKGLGAFKAK